MVYNANILLGRILKIQGYEGALTVKLEKDFIENIPVMESVFLEIDGKPVPFFISFLDYPGGDILRLKFEGYGTFEKVSEFAGCRVFLTTSDEKILPSGNTESIIGFKVILKNKNLIGKIDRIIQNPGQDLLKIISPGKKEILIPFHKNFILSFDERKKTIMVQLPEGLTDIN